MGIDLSGHQSSVSHHAADGFDRYAQRERDVCSEVVPRKVKGQIFDSVDCAQPENKFLQLLVGTYRQQPFVGTFGPILLDDAPKEYPASRTTRFPVPALLVVGYVSTAHPPCPA